MNNASTQPVSVLIATPSLDGMLECQYVVALLESTALLRLQNIKFEVLFEVGNSLIADARNKVLSKFLRSSHTHLLFIDSDLAWTAEDLVKILLLEVPFVAGVYQRKSKVKTDFTVKFKPNISRRADGLMPVERVGTGFMRLRRDCIEQLITAHPELKLQDANDQGNDHFYALFDTGISAGRFIGEDYMFCDRWRAIGGEVLIDPNMNFAHIGKQAFDLKLMDFLKQAA